MHATIYLDHRLDLGMIQMKLYPPFYFIAEKIILNGLSGAYVDDLLGAGKPNFKILSNRTQETFKWQNNIRNQPILQVTYFKGLRKCFFAELLRQEPQISIKTVAYLIFDPCANNSLGLLIASRNACYIYRNWPKLRNPYLKCLNNPLYFK